ncbi:hypothetical protein VTN02DRAFT_4407 [Thermoascus thermophilus]
MHSTEYYKDNVWFCCAYHGHTCSDGQLSGVEPVPLSMMATKDSQPSYCLLLLSYTKSRSSKPGIHSSALA